MVFAAQLFRLLFVRKLAVSNGRIWAMRIRPKTSLIGIRSRGDFIAHYTGDRRTEKQVVQAETGARLRNRDMLFKRGRRNGGAIRSTASLPFERGGNGSTGALMTVS